MLAERGARPARQEVAASFEATYHRPYLAHASMGPSSATALFGGGEDGQAGSRASRCGRTPRASTCCGPNSPARLASPTTTSRSRMWRGPADGHNGADDAAMDAALLAMAVPGRRSRWSGAGPTN